MSECKTILSDLVRSIVAAPERVTITEVPGVPLAFEVGVAERDYAIVVSKMSAIRTLTASFADLPESRQVIVHVTPV